MLNIHNLKAAYEKAVGDPDRPATLPGAKLFHEEPEAGKLLIRH
jgi:hypothetical protein